MEAEDIIESGDKAWARIRITGTNDGEFMGMPATEVVDLQAVDIVRFNDGRRLPSTGASPTR